MAIANSLWRSQLYSMFGFLLADMLLLTLVVALLVEAWPAHVAQVFEAFQRAEEPNGFGEGGGPSLIFFLCQYLISNHIIINQ